jgi:tricarballylate dehydrogenase
LERSTRRRLERATKAESGGNTRYTEAFLRMASLEAVAHDLEDRLLSDHMGYPDPGVLQEAVNDRSSWGAPMRTLDVVDGDVVLRLAEEAPGTLQWLTGHGMAFDALPTPFTQSTTRMSPVGGAGSWSRRLPHAPRSWGDVLLRDDCLSLAQDDSAVVTGVRTTPHGVLKGRVVLACGGFEGNTEMLARYMGPSALNTRPVARGGHYNKGEGIEMALAVGAAGAGNFGLFHAEPIDPRSGSPRPRSSPSLRDPREQAGPPVRRRGPGSGRRVVRAGHPRHPRPDGRHRLHGPRPEGDRGAQPHRGHPDRPDGDQRGDHRGARDEARGSRRHARRDRGGVQRGDDRRPVRPQRSGRPRDRGAVAVEVALGAAVDQGPYVAYPIIAANVFTFGGLRIDAESTW